MARRRGYILIGIDFGTTYSGVAWEWSERPEATNVVNHWEGIAGQKTSGKVPTRILYKDGKIKWGFTVPPDEKPLEWFKLLLLDEADMDPEIRNSTYIQEAKYMLKTLKKSAEDVVADYLRLLWQHALEDMKSDLGEAGLDGQPFRVVITFPAIWPLYAQSRMKQAAQTAGILAHRHGGETQLHLCPEPEAAALAVMHDFDGHPVESGEIFVICDAGGGTADLITYQVMDTTMWEVRECAAGAGKLCGAMLVDEAFDINMSSWVGERKWKNIAASTKRDWKEFHWEHGLKRNFNGAEQQWSFLLPHDLAVKQGLTKFKIFSRGEKKKRPPVKNNQIQLQRSHVATVFDVSVDRIVALVQEQIQKTSQRMRKKPTAVILVGGLGQSPYVKARLEDSVLGQHIGIRKRSDDQGWTSICRGAVLKASIHHSLEGGEIARANITSRVVRTSYGIAIMEPYDPLRHIEEDKKFIPAVGEEWAVNQMEWYLQMNENVGDQQTIIKDWSRKFRGQLPRSRFTVTLFKCDKENPPQRRDNDVKQEGEIVCLVNTPFDQLPQYTTSTGEVWKDVQFQVEMKPMGTVLEFAAHYNGQRQRALQVIPPFSSG